MAERRQPRRRARATTASPRRSRRRPVPSATSSRATPSSPRRRRRCCRTPPATTSHPAARAARSRWPTRSSRAPTICASGSTDPQAAEAYPIATFTWMLFYKKQEAAQGRGAAQRSSSGRSPTARRWPTSWATSRCRTPWSRRSAPRSPLMGSRAPERRDPRPSRPCRRGGRPIRRHCTRGEAPRWPALTPLDRRADRLPVDLAAADGGRARVPPRLLGPGHGLRGAASSCWSSPNRLRDRPAGDAGDDRAGRRAS